MIDAAKYYEIMEEPFRALCPERSGFMNFGLWPAPTLKAAQAALVRETLAALKKLRNSPSHVLETGSGWGAARALVAETFPAATYTGINLSAKQVEHSRRANAAFRSTNYVVAPVENLASLGLAGADALFAVEAAIHFKDKSTFLRNAASLGVRAIALAEILVEDMATVRANPYASPALHACWSLAEYRQGLAEAGFAQLEVRDVTKASFDGMADHTRGIDRKTFGENPVILAQLQKAFDDLAILAAQGKIRYAILSAAREVKG